MHSPKITINVPMNCCIDKTSFKNIKAEIRPTTGTNNVSGATFHVSYLWSK